MATTRAGPERPAARCFRDLIVWQKAHDFVLRTYRLTTAFPKCEIYGLTSQLRRAAVSVAANIAEGFRRRESGRQDPLPEYRRGIPRRMQILPDSRSGSRICRHCRSSQCRRRGWPPPRLLRPRHSYSLLLNSLLLNFLLPNPPVPPDAKIFPHPHETPRCPVPSCRAVLRPNGSAGMVESARYHGHRHHRRSDTHPRAV